MKRNSNKKDNKDRSRKLLNVFITLLLVAYVWIPTGCSKVSVDANNVPNVFYQEPSHAVAGEPLIWKVRFVVGNPAVEKGGELLLRFPHPYYFTQHQNWRPNPNQKGPMPIVAKSKNGSKLEVGYSPRGWHHPIFRIGFPDGLKPKDEVTIELGQVGGSNPSVAPVASTSNFSLLLLLDAYGNGQYHKILPKNATTIEPANPEKVEIVVPSQGINNGTIQYLVRLFDAYGNIAFPKGTLKFGVFPERNAGDAPVMFAELFPGDPGYKSFTLSHNFQPGVHRLKVTNPWNDVTILSNPIRIYDQLPKWNCYWGDMQGHSEISDGAGSADEYYSMLTGAAALDFGTLSDHEWQITDNQWRQIQTLCNEHYLPGKFVPLHAWEYSLGGHRLVYYKDCSYTPQVSFGGPKEMWEVEYNNEKILSWTKDAKGNPLMDFGEMEPLYQAHQALETIIVPHTSATFDMGNDWDAHDPALVQLVEIYSAHGSNEAIDSPKRVNEWVDRGSVRTALERGYRLGFIASGDSHDGKPGCTTWGGYSNGLTALWASQLDRDSIWEALLDKRVYATTGARILLDVSINGRKFFDQIESNTPPCIEMEINGTDEIKQIDLVSNGRIISSEQPFTLDYSRKHCDTSFDGLAYYYIRVIQADGEMAWSSPLWVHSSDVPWIENLDAKIEDGKFIVSWKESPIGSVGQFEILKRRGNDAGQDPRFFQKLVTLSPEPGKRTFIDEEISLPGITNYYLVRWISKSGKATPLGLVSAENPVENPAENNKFRINYAAEKPGAVSIKIYDLANRLVFQKVLHADAPGEFFFVWNGKGRDGKQCRGLHFYTIESEGFTSQRKPIRL